MTMRNLMKYSQGYYTMMVFGITYAIIALFLADANRPTLCAVMCVFAFIFLWGAQMLPDDEKYSKKYLGKDD